MDKNTVHELCFVIMERLAKNKVRGFPLLPLPDQFEGFVSELGKWEKERLLLEEERLVFVDHFTLNISILEKVLLTSEQAGELPSAEYFEEQVLRCRDKNGIEHAGNYKPQYPGKSNAAIKFAHTDQASRDFIYQLGKSPLGLTPVSTTGDKKGVLGFTPYFKIGDKTAKAVAHSVRKTIVKVIQDKRYSIQPQQREEFEDSLELQESLPQETKPGPEAIAKTKERTRLVRLHIEKKSHWYDEEIREKLVADFEEHNIPTPCDQKGWEFFGELSWNDLLLGNQAMLDRVIPIINRWRWFRKTTTS